MEYQEFDGKLDAEAGSFEPFNGELDKPKEKASLGTAVKTSFAGVGNMADTAASMLAGGAAGLFGQQAEQDAIYRNMEERNKQRMQWANPDNQELSTAGKIAGTVATLPFQIAAAGLSPAQTGKELIDAGESLATAGKGAAIDAAGNIVGMVAPGFKQGSLLTRAATGGAVNAAQEAATKQAISSMAETQAGKERFAPTMEDTAIAGILGGTLAAAGGKTRKSTIRDMDEGLFKPDPNVPRVEVRGTQMDMFGGPEGVLSDLGPQLPDRQIVEPSRGALSNKRQMDLVENNVDPLAVTREGVVGADETALYAREQQMQEQIRQLDAEQQQRAPGELFPEDPYQGTLADQGPQRGVLPEEAMQASRRQMELPLSEVPNRMDVTPEGVVGGDAMAMFAREQQMNKMVEDLDIENGIQRANELLNAEQLELSKTEAQIDMFDTVTQGPVPPLLSTYKPSGLYKKQGGWIKTPFGGGPVKAALNRNDRFKKFMEEMGPTKLSPEEFVQKYANAQDMKSDKMSHLAASGLYMARSSESPVVKYVTDLARDANSNIKAAIRDFVHTSYAPAWRSLKKDEFVRVAKLLNEADLRKQDIDVAGMKIRGFSDKAIQVVKQHQDMATNMYPKLKEGAELQGLAVPEQRAGYAAALMQGDFRRAVTNKDGQYLGTLGANTRYGLNKKVAQFKDKGYTIGPEVYVKGGGRDPMGFQQQLQKLMDNDPNVKTFVDELVESMSSENYLQGKDRTLGKKGTFGTSGRDQTKSDYDNARDFAEAQIKYAENIIQWNEMSKFVKDSKTVMEGMNNQPNSKSYLNDFVNQQLHRSTSEIGRGIDKTLDGIGEVTGLGTSGGAAALQATKKLINAKLLGLNVKFLVTNMIQPFKVSPEMTQFLSARGLPGLDPTGLSNLGKGAIVALQEQMGMRQSPVMQGALDYAQRKHVYSSDLFETSNTARRGVGFIADKVSQYGAQQVEKTTRQMMYLSLVDQLSNGGVKPQDGLYQVAHKLTDMAMVDYDSKPLIYSDLGSPGRAMSNLMSYKHNELSRLAMFARELPKNGSGRALTANLLTQVAVAGSMGLVGYSELDWVVRKLTEALGKPMGATEFMLKQGGNWDWAAYGPLSMSTGIDFSGSLGMEVMPGSLVDAVMPGVSSLGATVGNAAEAVTNPTEFNVRRAGREMLPLGFQGAYDRQMFSRENKDGEELAISPNSGQVTATRNDTDKAVRNFAFTGVNESKQKKLDWELQKTDKFYDDKRKSATKAMRNALFTGEGKYKEAKDNKDFAKAVENYIKYEGNPDQLGAVVEDLALDLNLSARQQKTLKDAASSTVGKMKSLQRSRGNE